MNRRGLGALTALSVVLAGACGGAGSVQARWSELPSSALPGWRSGPPFEAAVAAGGEGRPWLIGGVIPAAKDPSGGFRSFTYPTVAIWVSPTPTGPWRLASMAADRQRDGPNETIMFLAAEATPAVAFGWRDSPTEGYPRPSVWVAGSVTDDNWTEIAEDREFFGGPDVVGFGGVSAGPHGDFIAGTWAGPSGVPGVAVWRSRDGRSWSRDTTDPTFAGGPGQIAFVDGVADGPRGVVVAGTLEVPTRQNPTGRRGALWYSADGERWSRLDVAAISARMPDSAFGAVAATSAGWIVGATKSVAGSVRPVAWFIPSGAAVTSPVELGGPPSSGSTVITGAAVDASRAVLAGVSGGRPRLWTTSLRHGIPEGWVQLVAPPSSPVQSVEVSISGSGIVADLIGRTSSQIWTMH